MSSQETKGGTRDKTGDKPRGQCLRCGKSGHQAKNCRLRLEKNKIQEGHQRY
jgi:hypothetical protein